MSDKEEDNDREVKYELMSPEHRNFKMIERLTQKVDEVNNATQEKIEFIINQQAQLTANQQKAEEWLSKIEGVLSRLANLTLGRLENADAKIGALSEDVDRKISALVDAHVRTEESIRNLTEDTDAKIRALVDAHVRTEESIRNLSAVVDRYFNEGRNGGS